MQRENTQLVGKKRDKQHEYESTALARVNPSGGETSKGCPEQ